MFFARLRDFLGSTCWIPAPGYDVTGQQISNKPQITNDFIRVQRRAYHLTRDTKGNIIREIEIDSGASDPYTGSGKSIGSSKYPWKKKKRNGYVQLDS